MLLVQLSRIGGLLRCLHDSQARTFLHLYCESVATVNEADVVKKTLKNGT
jgi:hypothetical protein